jgi:hypothetical protein
VILLDDEFDEVVRADLHMIKQAWAVIEKGDKSFTHVVSKSQKKIRAGPSPKQVRLGL